MSILLSTASAEISDEDRVGTERRRSETNFKKARRFDKAASLLLWTSAAVTLGILIYILGFIIYRGFRTDNIVETEYLDIPTVSLPLDIYEENSVFIVNGGIRLKKIEQDDLNSLLKGKPSNWGNINGQDLKVSPNVLDGAAGEFGKNMIYRKTAAEIIEAVEKQPGAMGLIPAGFMENAEAASLKIIPVHMSGIGVHPGVFEIEKNIKLRYIDKKILVRLFSGEITNWSDAAGIDLKVSPVIPPPGSFELDVLLELTGAGSDKDLYGGAVRAKTVEEYYALINGTAGAVGIVRTASAKEYGTALLNYRYRETGANLKLWFLLEEPKRAGRVGGISSIIVNTVYMVILTVLFSTPLGIGAAVYLTEYAKQGRLVRILRLGTETLAGIPSIIFGLFGFIVFVTLMRLGIGLLSGTLTLTLMILPTIVRTAEEAIKAVPRSFRAGSLALGAGKWQTIYKVVLPAAAPGILTGVILAIGRAVGETAALLFTMGFDYRTVKNLSTSARVLSTHLYQLVKEGISFDRAFATATILIFIVLIVNVLTTKLIKRRY